MTVRLGAVSYLNTRPLTIELERDSAPFELRYDVPAACAADLREGRVDLGLIPSIEYACSQIPYYIVPDVAIGCRSEALTVRLFFRGELENVKRVAVDRSSQTSVALLRILLKERYGLEPYFHLAPPDLDAMLHTADGALLIGDPVLPLVDAAVYGAPNGAVPNGETVDEKPNSHRRSLDLGREWVEFSGHPFVFAFWAGRKDAVTGSQVEALIRAKRCGEERVEEIARAFQRERAGSADLYERYLRDHISFGFGPEEIAGLQRFYRLAHAHKLIGQPPELRFFERSIT